MNEQPRVTVVIPTRNRAALLAEAIASVLAQSFRNIEIIICDDGSTDDTATLARSFGPPVRYLPLAHSGRPGPPRNRGLEAARGDLIGFLDDDDLWDTDKLLRQVALFEHHPEIGFVYSDRRLLDGASDRAALVQTPSPPPSGKLLDVLCTGECPCICTALIRRDLLRQTGGFDESLDYAGEEIDLWFRLARITRAARVPEPLVTIRRLTRSRVYASSPLDHAIVAFERQLNAGDLRVHQRLLCHATLSRLHYARAATLAREGDRHGALCAALRALRHRPVSPRAWVRVVRSSLPLT